MLTTRHYALVSILMKTLSLYDVAEDRHFPYFIEYLEVKKLFHEMRKRDAITGKRGWVKKKAKKLSL